MKRLLRFVAALLVAPSMLIAVAITAVIEYLTDENWPFWRSHWSNICITRWLITFGGD